jgi:outer membrane protein OmpA-like peptidoglycan-associated protein
LKLLLGLALAALCAACATPPPPKHVVAPELFAVVPGADGHVGAIVVHSGGDTHLIDSAYGAERITSEGTRQTSQITASEVSETFGATLAALPGKPTSFMLYFLEAKDELTPESKVEMGKVFSELKKRPLPDILVIGHTDSVGSMTSNDRLSLARAERMRELLIGLGIPAERIQASGRGKRELLVPTEDNVSEPRNRRVEISVR